MTTWLRRFDSRILGVTRVLVGVMLALHGAQKFGALGGVPEGVPAFIIWVAGSIELVGGLLLAAGLFTTVAAFLMSGLMAAAYFLGHAGQGFWPILNGGELPIVYSWLSLYLAAHGPGAWAIDNVRGATIGVRAHQAA